MTRRDLAELVLLAALWGASFLFMRMGAAEFGPAALVFVRVAGASALLLPLLAWRGEMSALRAHWRPIAAIGALNSALPFLLFMVAALALSAGLMAVFNATAPIWGALVAWLWLGEKLDRDRWIGLAIGVAGVVGLSWGKADLRPGAQGVSAAWGIARSRISRSARPAAAGQRAGSDMKTLDITGYTAPANDAPKKPTPATSL